MGLALIFFTGFGLGIVFGIWRTLKSLKQRTAKNAEKYLDGLAKRYS